VTAQPYVLRFHSHTGKNAAPGNVGAVVELAGVAGCRRQLELPVNGRDVVAVFRGTPPEEDVVGVVAVAGLEMTAKGHVDHRVHAAEGDERKVGLACGLAKPDGIKQLWPEDVPAVLWPLDVSVLPGVGPKTGKRLEEMGIRSVGDLAAKREEFLVAALGSLGATLWRYAHGLDDRELETAREEKSLGAETTFPRDVRDREEALAALAALCEDVGWRLRQKGLLAKTVTVKIRYADYSTVTRSATLPRPVCTDGAVWRAARELLLRHAGRGPWRLVGVQLTNLVDADWRQLSLLEGPPAGDARREARSGAGRAKGALRQGRGAPRQGAYAPQRRRGGKDKGAMIFSAASAGPR